MKRFYLRFPVVFSLVLLSLVIIYNFSFYFPFTNNAFVVANTRPVAANVYGYITDLYVSNEQYVVQGQPLFTVFQKPYQLAYKKACSDVAEAQAQLAVYTQQVEKTKHLIDAQREIYQRLQFDFAHYKRALADQSVSQIAVNTLLKNRNAAFSRLQALERQLIINQERINVQRMRITSRIAIRDNAAVDLDETVVKAKANGFVHNLFISVGTPVIIRKPLFSFVESDQLFIQANFSEIDLRRVKPGNRVTIIPRMYFGSKVYHGLVTSKHWASSRQITDKRSQQQIVTNSENNWILLPQRFPVQIKITDYNPDRYPLSIGSSAYVYIHTH